MFEIVRLQREARAGVRILQNFKQIFCLINAYHRMSTTPALDVIARMMADFRKGYKAAANG